MEHTSSHTNLPLTQVQAKNFSSSFSSHRLHLMLKNYQMLVYGISSIKMHQVILGKIFINI